MDIVTCPHCGTGVILTSEGICPSCRKIADHGGFEVNVPRSVIDDNPYRAPEAVIFQTLAPVKPEQRGVKLYSPKQVAGASFLGSPIAGFWLLASNYRSLGSPSHARRSILFGIVSTPFLFAFGSMLPDKFPSMVLPAAMTWFMYMTAQQLQEKVYEAHLARGGATYSNWRVVGIGLLTCVILLLIVILPLIALALTGHEEWIPG